MAETRYNVIFKGQLAEGQQIEDVKKRLAAAYKCDVAKIERTFFAGKTFIAKKDVDHQTAVKVLAALNRTGGIFNIVEIEPTTPPQPEPKPSAPKETPAQTTPPAASDAPLPIAPKTPEKAVIRPAKPTPPPAKPAKRRSGKMALVALLLLLLAGGGVGLYQFGLLDVDTLGRISKGVENFVSREQQPASTNNVATTANNTAEAEEVEAVKTLPTAFSNAAFSVDIPGIRNWIVPVNEYLDVAWKAQGNLVSNGDEMYEFIVFSMPNTVRFKGAGFLMLPPETTLPFGFKLHDDQLRVLFPLYLLKDATQGTFQVRPLLAGDFTLQWEYVTVNKNGKIEHSSAQDAKEPQAITFEVRDMRPQIIVQDKVGSETPERVIVSPSGEYEARIFKERFQVLYSKTGELILEKAGIEPRFSPNSRFLSYTAADSLKVMDILYQEVLPGDMGYYETISWGKNDSYLIIGYSTWGAVNIILPLLDEDNIISNELGYKGFSCHVCNSWQTTQLSIDLENAIITFRTNNPFMNAIHSLISKKKESLNEDGIEDNRYSDMLRVFGLPIINRKPPKYWELDEGFQVTHFYGELAGIEKFFINPIFKKDDTHPPIQAISIQQEKGTLKGNTTYREETLYKVTIDDLSNKLLSRFYDFGLPIQKNVPPSEQKEFRYDFLAEGENADKNQKVKMDFLNDIRKNHSPHEDSTVKAVNKHLPICLKDFTGYYLMTNYYYWNNNNNNQFLLSLLSCQGYVGSSGIGGNDGEIFISSLLSNHQNYNNFLSKTLSAKLLGDKQDVNKYIDRGLFDFEANGEEIFFSEDGNFLIAYWGNDISTIMIFDAISNTLTSFLTDISEIHNLHSLHISQDKKLLLQINQGGTFYIYDISIQKCILNGAYLDDEIVLYTDDGFYDSTLEGASYVTWHYPGLQTHFNFAQFESQFKRPDIIQALLVGQPVEKPTIKLVPPPTVELVVNHAGNFAPQVTVEVSASSILPLKNMRLFVNGAPAAEIPASGTTANKTLTLDLQRGKQWLTAVAYNSRGYSSTPKSVLLDASNVNAPGGALYVVGVGVNAYPKMPENNLAYAVNDVTAFADALKANPNKQYERVIVKNLYDAQATAANIRQALTETIAQATANDTVMLYFSGHGGKGGDEKFYFLTPDASFDDLEQTGLRWEEVAALLVQSKAKVVVFLDACHSGAASQTTFVPNDAYVAELMKSGKAGMAILASSKGRQSSYEDDTFKHGLFNYAITQAFTKDRKKTDANQDGVIELSELYRSVKFQVNQLSEGDQTPWLSRNEIIGETPLL